ncbi:MAG: DNA polymerase/3'-5' exonuclease PolX [Gammaproteobacteria bacterium]|nr:DNA polymerase/3'-5' exonuclease PolX [Gammaproteobacteria bacterium]
MNVTNADIAAIFEEIADILAIENANPYRVRAYRNAARVVRAFGGDIATLLESGRELPKLPGIGQDLAAKIREIAATGTCALRQRLRRQVPPALVELLDVTGLGPKRVRLLYHDLGVETPEQLLQAAGEGRVRRLHGFGVKTEARLLQALTSRIAGEHRVPLAEAALQAESLVAHLRDCPGVSEVDVAGSFRRMRDTVGDLDFVVAARRAAPVMQHFLAYDRIGEVISSGPTRASMVLQSGLQVDLRVIRRASYGAALVYFTGSKAHTIAIRKLAREHGLKINEYGVFRGERRIAGDTEASVYAALDLPWIAPELREDRGELEAAAEGRLPHLVERDDLRGDLHAHTRASDGLATLEEMAAAARADGLEYLAITEHSPSLTVAHGLDGKRLLRHIDKIDRLNARLKGITLLKGVEVDILRDGSLDLPDDVLARLDLVAGAIHSHFDLPRADQTRRLLRAMEHRYFSILAHPTGRLLGQRQPYDIDIDAVIDGVRRRGCFLELNAQSQRLDLVDTYCRQAARQGILISIDTDAHSPADFGNLRFGVGQARRGWLEKKDVLNSRTLGQLRKLLHRCHRHAAGSA